MGQFLVDIVRSPIAGLHVLFSALLGYWIYLDASELGSSAALLWAIGCVVFQPLTLGYLLYRSEIGGRVEPAGVRERLVGTAVVAHLLAVQLRFALGIAGAISTPVSSPAAEGASYAVLFAVGALAGYWLVWRRGWARVRRRFGWVHEAERSAVRT